jgi:cobalt-zinc-cadmium efflux system protein
MNDHHHEHNYKSLALRRLILSLSITAVVMVVEVIGGWLTGSIALISDAGHMLTHAFAIAVSIFGIVVARRPACHHRTFGLLRAEVVAAFVNALFLLAVTAWIVFEAAQRFLDPQPILTLQMLAVAIVGLTVNVVSIFLLESSRRGDLNVHSVFLHMIGDAASSVAIVVAAILIRVTQWLWIDPLVSVGIAVLIAIWAASLLRESLRVLLEMAPKGHTVDDIISAMRAKFPEIVDTEHEHVWTITPSVVCFSAHLTVDAAQLTRVDVNDWLHRIEHWLRDKFDVSESTLQLRHAGRGKCQVAGGENGSTPTKNTL